MSPNAVADAPVSRKDLFALNIVPAEVVAATPHQVQDNRKERNRPNLCEELAKKLINTNSENVS